MYLLAEHLYQKNGNIDLPKKSKKYIQSAKSQKIKIVQYTQYMNTIKYYNKDNTKKLNKYPKN